MVAGISGATPGSGAGADWDEAKLRQAHAAAAGPKQQRQAETTARLATVRACPELIMAFPRTNLAAPVTQPSAKPLPEQ